METVGQVDRLWLAGVKGEGGGSGADGVNGEMGMSGAGGINGGEAGAEGVRFDFILKLCVQRTKIMTYLIKLNRTVRPQPV